MAAQRKGGSAREPEPEQPVEDTIVIDVSDPTTTEQLQALWQQNSMLRTELSEVRQRLGDFWRGEEISAGISNLIAELEPLKYLQPPEVGEGLPQPVTDALLRMRSALARPDWHLVTTIEPASSPGPRPIGSPIAPAPTRSFDGYEEMS